MQKLGDMLGKNEMYGICFQLKDGTMLCNSQLKEIWNFLNVGIIEFTDKQPETVDVKITSEHVTKVSKPDEKTKADDKKAFERAYKKEQDINAIKKAVADRKMSGGRGIPYSDDFDNEVVRLHDDEQMSFTAIGKELNCSPTTAQSHYEKMKGKGGYVC